MWGARPVNVTIDIVLRARFSRLDGISGSGERLRETLAFASAALRSPASVGAVAPASRWLGRAIVREIVASRCRTVVEIGAGTGALTRAIMARVRDLDRLVAVERDPGLVRWLRRSFPGVEIVQACASDIEQVTRPQVPTAIVSSLPFRSMNRLEAARCSDAFQRALALDPRSVLIQYTYGLGPAPPFPASTPGFTWYRTRTVLMNVPPATIWILQPPRPQ